jgi:hypothetical protein
MLKTINLSKIGHLEKQRIILITSYREIGCEDVNRLIWFIIM